MAEMDSVSSMLSLSTSQMPYISKHLRTGMTTLLETLRHTSKLEKTSSPREGKEEEPAELLCKITETIPQEPVKLIGATKLQVYEKSALADWLSNTTKDPASGETVKGMDDYMDATADVCDWVEDHLHLPEAHHWMLVRLSSHMSAEQRATIHMHTLSALLEGVSPRMVGEMVMHKVRRVTPREVRFAGTTGFYSQNTSFKRIEFDPISTLPPPKLDDGLAELLKVPGVYWAKECQDGRGLVVVAVVRFLSDECVTAVKHVWETSMQGCPPLVVLEMRPQPAFSFKRTPAMRIEATNWWKANTGLVQELLQKHPRVVTAFIDQPVRHGRALDEIALVLFVDVKGFIPLDDTPLPTEVAGLKTDVQSGSISALASTTAHPNAWDPDCPKCFIGRSVGSERRQSAAAGHLTDGPGTLGAVVTKNGEHYGLTCAHVVKDNKYVISPSPFDQVHKRKIPHVAFKLDVVETCTLLDAALIRCSGVAEGPRAPCDAAACWTPTTNEQRPGDDNDDGKTSRFHQSGRHALLPLASGGTYQYFGRTSGQCSVEFVLSQEAMLKKFTTTHNNDDNNNNNNNNNADNAATTDNTCCDYYQTRLLMTTTGTGVESLRPREGDSGSVVWQVQPADSSLDGVGLLCCQLKDNPDYPSRYLFATPIEPVLHKFGCEFARSPELPPLCGETST